MEKKTKILHVTFNMNFGGAEKVIQHLVENLDSDEFISDVVCIDPEVGPLGKKLIEQGYSVVHLDRKQGLDLSIIRKLNKLINEGQYNVVHCHQYTPYLYGVLASIPTKARVIFTEHGRFYPDFGTLKRKAANRVLQLITYKIVAISEATKRALVKHENFSASSIQVIYNGIEDMSSQLADSEATREQWSIPADHTVLGTISRLQPIKNQKLMIEAFAEIVKTCPDSCLMFVGDGPVRENLETQALNLGLQDKTIFTGFQDDPHQFHRMIDVFLLSSFSEGTSMTLLEAMSHSKPCVVTDVGGNTEVVENEKTGYVVESVTDAGKFSKQCFRLINDKFRRQEFGANARDRFKQRFTIGNMVESYSRLYREIPQANSKP